MRINRMAAAVVAAVTLAAGTGAAVAATGDDDETAIIDRAARDLDVTAAELRDALRSAREAEIDQSVADGELTEEQGEALKQRLRDSGRVLGGPGGHGRGGHHGRGFMGIGSELAEALGVSEEELRSAFAEGKTVGEIAEEQGRELADVRRALRAAAVERLDEAVSGDRITEAERDAMVKRLDAKLDELADFGGRRFGPHHGMHRGGAGDGGTGDREPDGEDASAADATPRALFSS